MLNMYIRETTLYMIVMLFVYRWNVSILWTFIATADTDTGILFCPSHFIHISSFIHSFIPIVFVLLYIVFLYNIYVINLHGPKRQSTYISKTRDQTLTYKINASLTKHWHNIFSISLFFYWATVNQSFYSSLLYQRQSLFIYYESYSWSLQRLF